MVRWKQRMRQPDSQGTKFLIVWKLGTVDEVVTTVLSHAEARLHLDVKMCITASNCIAQSQEQL